MTTTTTSNIVKLTSTCWSTLDGKYDIKKVAPAVFGVRKIENNQVVGVPGCFQTFAEAVTFIEGLVA